MARTATRKNRGKKTRRGHSKKTRRSALRSALPPKIQRVRAIANLTAFHALLNNNGSVHEELENLGVNLNGNRNGRENPRARALNANENTMNNLAESIGRMGRNNLPK